MSIRIVCDSTCNLTPGEAKEKKIDIVPLKVLFGTEEYRDGVDMTPAAFFEKLAAAEEMPTTSQPSPEAFLQVFEEAKAAGDEVLCLLLSSEWSGTYQSACIAADMAEYDRIFVVDSGSTSLGMQLLIDTAVSMREEGKSAEEIAAVVEEEKKKIQIYVVLETLEYLQKGGRLSTTGMIAGKVLNLKPVITASGGEIHVCGVARGMKGAYEKIWKIMQEEGACPEKGFYLGYTGDESCLEPFRTFLSGKMDETEKGTVAVGSVIGVHVGPGGNAIATRLK